MNALCSDIRDGRGCHGDIPWSRRDIYICKTITLHVFVSLSDCKEADAVFGLMSFSKRYWRKAVERNTQTPVSGAQTLEQFSHVQLPI